MATTKDIYRYFAIANPNARITKRAAAVSSDGLWAWSYAEPIACKRNLSDHDLVVWVTDRKFSVTTSKHTNQVIYALQNEGFRVVRSDTMPRSAEDWDQLIANKAA